MIKPNSVAWIVWGNAFQFGEMGSTQRFYSIKKALENQGFKVVLVSGAYAWPEVQKKYDKLLQGPIYRTKYYGPYPSIFSGLANARKAFRAFLRLRGPEIYWSGISSGWAKKLTDKEIDQVTKDFGFPSLIWSMSGGLLESHAFAKKAAEHLRCKHIVELHDPPFHAGLGYDLDVVVKEFHRILFQSDFVVTNSHVYGKELKSQFPFLSEKLTNIPLSYESDFLEVPKSIKINGKIVLSHFGTLNEERSIIPFLSVLLRTKFSDGFILKLAGQGDGIARAIDFLEKNGRKDQVINLGLITREEVIHHSENSDCLLVIQPASARLEVPGKVFSMMASMKPIIGWVSKGSETANILQNSLFPLIGNEMATLDLEEYIERMYFGLSFERSTRDKILRNIECFSQSALEEKVAEVLRLIFK